MISSRTSTPAGAGGTYGLGIPPLAPGDLLSIAGSGSAVAGGVKEVPGAWRTNLGLCEVAGKLIPTEFALGENFPNPFNPETQIHYAVADPATVRIDVHNSVGQKIRTLVEAHHTPGIYSVSWDGRDMNGQKVTGGVYIYTMEAGSFREGGKMVLMP